jgi:hypothetical protein
MYGGKEREGGRGGRESRGQLQIEEEVEEEEEEEGQST